jgi:hypothetical protein
MDRDESIVGTQGVTDILLGLVLRMGRAGI